MAVRERIAIDTTENSNVGTVRFQAVGSTPGLIILEEADGTPHYLWVDSTGDLRIHTASPTTPDSDGTVVGAQT